MTTVILYKKPDCCLCDEALEVIERVQRDHDFALEQVDIRSDPELLGRHGERIPVILVDGDEKFVYRVDEGKLRRLVGTAAEVAP
jgi:hypothetical protein